MKMSTELLTLTEKNINDAFKDHNVFLMQKEAIFLLNNYAMNLSEAFSNVIEFIKPINVRLKTEPNFIFKEAYVSSLKKVLNYSEQLIRRQIDLIEAKLFFDSWFYEITNAGILKCFYNEEELVNISDAADYLGVSRTTIYKYIDRGLETVGEKNNQKIPRFMLEAWKNQQFAFQMQWISQLKRAREQTIEQRLAQVNKQIEEFEKEYGKPFYVLFGNMTDKEIDAHPEAVDIYDWRELEREKQELLGRLKGE